MVPIQVRFGWAVQKLRRKAGYSQEAFADRVGVHRTYMGTIERGEKNISLRNIERIALAIGLTAGELVSASDEAMRPRSR